MSSEKSKRGYDRDAEEQQNGFHGMVLYQEKKCSINIKSAVSYTHLDVYKRQNKSTSYSAVTCVSVR